MQQPESPPTNTTRPIIEQEAERSVSPTSSWPRFRLRFQTSYKRGYLKLPKEPQNRHSSFHSIISPPRQAKRLLCLSQKNLSHLLNSWQHQLMNKGGRRGDRSNYRPISVLPVGSRLFEKLIYDQLYNYLDKNRYLVSHQSVFRSLHWVVTCLLKATNDWYLDTDRRKYTGMIFLDLKKAFDTVDDQILHDKMQFYGVTGLAHKRSSSYRDNRKQYCKVNGTASSIKNTDVRVTAKVMPRTPSFPTIHQWLAICMKEIQI